MPLSKLQRLSTRNQERIDQLATANDWPGLAAFARDNLKRDPASGDWWTVLGNAMKRRPRRDRLSPTSGVANLGAV